MQIIIELDDEIYKQISTNIDVYVLDEVNFILIENAIANGTPLPKGHGRLGDLDELEKEMDNGIKAGLMINGYERYSNINDMDDCLECVKFAPTIIESDKGE